MIVVGTPLDEGEGVVGDTVVCGGVQEDLVMTPVLLDTYGKG